MGTKMETLYAELAEYFVFDKQKYTLEEFFSDIKTFKDQFKQAYDSIIKERESEAKLIRAREEREKAERVSGFLFHINFIFLFCKFYSSFRGRLIQLYTRFSIIALKNTFYNSSNVEEFYLIWRQI